MKEFREELFARGAVLQAPAADSFAADVGALAGCEFDFGNPVTKLTQPMSLICLLTGIHLPDVRDMLVGYNDHLKAKDALKEELKRGGNIPTYGNPSLFHVIDDIFLLMANHQYKLSAINADDVTKATLAGRCISGDFIAHSSYRVTGNAVALGEAAGKTAAAWCSR